MLKVRKIVHRTTYSLTTDDGSEVEVQFEPCKWGDMHAERVGDKLVVAYLSNDEGGYSNNPMTESDGQGTLYTKPRGYGGVTTDDRSGLLDALQLDGENEVRPQVRFELEGVTASLEDHAVTVFMFENGGCDLAREWINEGCCSRSYEEHELVDEDLYVDWRDDIEFDILNGQFKYDEHQALMLKLYAKHWREIVGPFVVPVNWCENNHGPGTASASVTSWDGDPDDLPSGVWVADKDVQANVVAYPPGLAVGQIKGEDGMYTPEYELTDNGVRVHRGTLGACWGWMRTNYKITPGDLQRAVEGYAEAVLTEYASWCNGDVYGCCVETFKKVGDEDDAWESTGSDECWGFIGSDHAEQSLLDEFFKPAVEAARKEQA